MLYQVDKNARATATLRLAYLEKYMSADKGYVNDVSAKALAYQIVKQRCWRKSCRSTR